MKKSIKINVYTEALKEAKQDFEEKIYNNGICNYIDHAEFCIIGRTRWKEQKINYPELQKYKPLNPKTIYWFPQTKKGLLKRIEILTELKKGQWTEE